VISAQVDAAEASVVRALEADVTSVALAVAVGSMVEATEGVTSITEPLEIDWYGPGGGGGGPGGGGAAPFGPGGGGGDAGPCGGGGAAFPGGGSAEAEARPKPSAKAASVETILEGLSVVIGRDDNSERWRKRPTLYT
jgi:hypothetical protein